MQAESVDQKWVPSSEAEKAAVLEQLDRLLLDPYFKNSKRYPSFLRFVVGQALEGESDSLKERVLGVEVFGRSPDYDSTQDPIVRVTAAEIRKRILKYYQDPGHQGEIRLSLPAGSYVPLFEHPESSGAVAVAVIPAYAEPIAEPASLPIATATAAAPIFPAAPPVVAAPASAKPRHFWKFATAAALLLTLVGSAFFWNSRQHSLIEAFWTPILDSPHPVLFCIADQSGYAANAMPASYGPVPGKASPDSPTLVAAEDTVPLADIVSILRPKNHPFHVQVEGQTNFTDLTRGPSVLIGAFDNKWTIFATNPLRFHFANNPGLKQIWIEDHQHPEKRDWLVDADASEGAPRKDYAIVARFIDANTSQPTVVVAGLGHNGTSAAGSFLLSPQSLAELDKIDSQLVRSRNLEIVLETLVVNGHPGTPHIVATHTW